VTYEEEETLRARARHNRSYALVLADAYESAGQITRAELWRNRKPKPDKVDPDLFARRTETYPTPVDPRRDQMIWLMSQIRTRSEVAKLFRLGVGTISMIVKRIDRQTEHRARIAANDTRDAAILRLRAAGALRGTLPTIFGSKTP